MTLHLKSRGYPFRPRLLFSSFIVVGVGSPNCVLFQERTKMNSYEEEDNLVQHCFISDLFRTFASLFTINHCTTLWIDLRNRLACSLSSHGGSRCFPSSLSYA